MLCWMKFAEVHWALADAAAHACSRPAVGRPQAQQNG